MKTIIKTTIVSACLILVAAVNLSVAEEQIYGSQLMTEQERAEHRTKMQSLKTDQERARYRLEHHKKMQQRAKQQGKALPDMPPQAGGMQHHKGGSGQGKGR